MSNVKVTPVAPHEDDLDTKYTTFGIDAATLDHLNVEQMTEQNKAKLIEFGGAKGIAKLLCVDIDNGLADYEIKNNFARRREKFGTNSFPEPPSATFIELFLDCFKDTTVIILCLAAVASLITGILEHPESGWIEGFAIILAVIIVAMVTSTNNYTKEKQFRQLNAKNDEVYVKVIRDGRPDQAMIGDINVGDIVHLDAGDKVPADGIYIKGQDAKANESSLTGEPDDVTKNSTEDPFLLSGCVLASGYCDMLVIAIGKNSRWGKIRSKLALEHPPTPLMEKLEVMAKFIGYVGMGTSICTMIIMIIKYFASEEKRQSVSIPSQLIDALLVGITIVVVAIPEGLPLAVTISLSYSTKKMLRDNNLIRVLSACETMGNVTSICSDKTGTLTENRMTVVEAYVFGKYYNQNELKNKMFQFEKTILNDLAVNISCNSSAQIITKNNMIRVLGNKTEGALLLWINSLNYEHDILRSENLKDSRGDRQFPFSSLKKTMAAVCKKPGGGFRLYSKGASEIVFERCDRIRMSDGAIRAIDDTIKKEVQNVIIQMAQNALRTFCVAWRDFEENELPADLQTLQEAPDTSGLICDSIFGIMDPLRADVPDAVAMCHKAGIMVRMVTGDNIHTATAIAKQCGIFTADGIALEGPKFRVMSDEELEKVITRLQVLARSSPDDKFKLVNYLKARREVVGVTGDGTNDAPALKTADVGLSMGISGTDLAKEASDIVIMDDRFSSIKQAVLWGRSVYDNIRKFLCFQLTVNVVALVITFISAIFGFNPPLNAVMMLWVNLIMDTMGALALGTEEPTAQLLERRPYRRDASILSRMLWKNILVQAAFQIAVLLILLLLLPDMSDIRKGNYCERWKLKSNFSEIVQPVHCYTISENSCDAEFTTCWDPEDPLNLPANFPRHCVDYCTKYDYTHYSFIFNTFVFCQVFNEFNSRCVGNDPWIFRNITRNPIFVMIILFTVFLQILMVQVAGSFMKTTALSIRNLFLSVAIASITLPLGFLMRFIPIEEDKSQFANPNNIQRVHDGKKKSIFSR